MSADKPRLEDTHFFRLHKILQERPNDRALRVDRSTLEGMMVELISAARRVEKVQQAIKDISPAMDFTSDESPQDTIISLLNECRDTIDAVANEAGISDKRKEYRAELVTRITTVLGAA